MNALAKLEQLQRSEPIAFRAPADLAPAGRSVTWKTLPEQTRQEVDEKLRFLAEVDDLARIKSLSKEHACGIVACRRDLFPTIAAAGRNGGSLLSYRNYRQWSKALGTKSGHTDYTNRMALVPGYAAGPRTRKGADEFWATFMNRYLTQKRWSVKMAYQTACVEFRKANPVHDTDDIPKLQHVKYVVEHHLDQDAVALARFGPEYYRNHFGDYIDRDWSAVAAGAVWVGDNRKFDVFIKRFDEEKQTWQAVRPWISAWMDARSGYVAGWRITDRQPNSAVVAGSFILGIRDAGGRAPDFCYIDNGKDFVRQGLFEPVTLDGNEHCAAKSLGVKTIIALPYNARAKIIEGRLYGAFSRHFDRMFPSYVANCMKFRDKDVQEFVKEPADLLTLGQFTATVDAWINDVYHHTETESKISDRMTPAQAWAARPTSKPGLSDADLAMRSLIPYRHTRTVTRGARITVENHQYQNRDELRHHINSGHQFMVKLDLFSTAHVYIYELDGRFVCEATEVQTLPAIGADHDQLSARMHDARSLESASRAVVKRETGRAVFSNDYKALQLLTPEATPQLPNPQPPAALPAPNPTPKPDGDPVFDADTEDLQAFDQMVSSLEPDETGDDDGICLDDLQQFTRLINNRRDTDELNQNSW